MNNQRIVTRNSITQMLNNPNRAYVEAVVGRALVRLLNRQTREEAQTNTTQVHNLRGFTHSDAKAGSITAKYFIKHGKLLDWQIERWTRVGSRGYPRLAIYWRQLDQEAQAARRQEQEKANAR